MQQPIGQIQVALVDDHKLFRRGLVELINGFTDYKVVLEATNGKEFIQKLSSEPLPDLVLLDVNMPEMDGYETATWLRKHHPSIKILVLSMYDSETAIIKMLRIGVSGYILKDAETHELKHALDDLIQKGFYYSDLVSGTLAKSIAKPMVETHVQHIHGLNDREIEFLKMVCTELTYKEIADQMCLSVRTIDGYREHLFEKLNVRSRVGLVLFAIRSKIISVS
ncbi:response regulator transcription factor [Cytophagaceae bacterium DM2B3-1]|uniref:Response regulator transcription factor n=1 Tax=Xanthocytophaga flava TaxID=3048013 RepID=A0ABT7CUL8_9BACT|nr:response regulator transcription factor [Xanthocytophaga flavus]MDJ1497423.1 response regulator transcription factor [Xanthocytophaga flavus]